MSPILGSRGISPRGYGFAGAGKPNAPVSVVATDVGTSRAYNNGAASVAFSSGGDNGAPITSFTVTSSPSGFTASGASSPLVVTGLASSTSYTFTVTATNSFGTSDASSASSAITATTVPQAPTIGTATGGNASATVTYTAGATGGKAISTFTATSTPSSITGTGASPITVSGLSNGTAYTFKVKATNANGTSLESAASNSVTPVNPTFTVDYVVVAGGGGTNGQYPVPPLSAGQGALTSGAGAGGYLASTLSVTVGNSFTVTVGAGGPGSGTFTGINGSDSVLSGVTATGGGGTWNISASGGANTGGSGAGGSTLGTPNTGQPGTAGQGNAGGTYNSNPGSGAGGGGGGAGGAGGNGQVIPSPNWYGGAGGVGIASSITGTSVGRAGGGGGASAPFSSSGTAFGGAGTSGGGTGGTNTHPGTNTAAVKNGTANTGGGAGGNSGSIAPSPGFYAGTLQANGGSGVVIIAYPDSNPALSSIGGGLSYTQPTRSGYRVYQFNGGTGTVTV